MELSTKLLEDYEFTTPSLSSMTDAGHAFSIPWDRQVRAMMAGFDSAGVKEKEGPWKLSSPFDLSGATLSTIVPDTSGGIASFRDGFSTQSGVSTEHLSAALGITVGYPFLNASVSGKYDKNVMMNNNVSYPSSALMVDAILIRVVQGIKASRNATCRMGRVVLASSPILSQSALTLLESANGPARFRAAYGDYYICGYELGADAGVCLSASTESTTTTQSLEITVAVKILFYTASKTHTERSSSFSTSSTMTFCGYNSLEQKTDELTSPDKSTLEQQARLRDASAEYMKKVGSLDSEVRVSMARLGLEDAQKLPLSVCPLICQSGLVVELLLAPFARLNQYVKRASRLQMKPLEL